MSIIDAFNDNRLEQDCNVLAEMFVGLSGSEIYSLHGLNRADNHEGANSISLPSLNWKGWEQ